MVTDADHDGYSTGASATACVGASRLFNGRTYYANTAGAFVSLDASAALGASDCLDSNANVFTSRAAATDADHDGFTTTTTTSAPCTGASSVINTRTYYSDSAGNPNWLGSASATADCNDANAAISGTTLYYADGDGDTFGAGTGTARCAPVGTEVTNNTDCDDANAFINTTRMVAMDADNDSFTTTTTLGSQCTGASQLVSGRTYYRNASNALAWLGTASTVVDCNDASAAVFPQTYYVDGDGDGKGLLSGAALQCPQQAGYVSNSADCNDGNALIYQTISALYDDATRTGTATSARGSFCVGGTVTAGGRTYYRNSAGAYAYTTTILGADCNTGQRHPLHHAQTNVVRDDDRDGYPASVTDLTQCAGATSTVGSAHLLLGRHRRVLDGARRLHPAERGQLRPGLRRLLRPERRGHFRQTAYFTTHRGDGSFDYDCSGAATASTAGTYCASTTSGVALFTDGTCGTSAGTGTICTSPTAFVLPAACGKVLAGAGTFTNGGVCTADTLASATTIGCR